MPYWQAASLWLLTRVSSFLCRMLAWQHKRGHSMINLSMSGQFIISLVLQRCFKGVKQCTKPVSLQTLSPTSKLSQYMLGD